MTLKKWTLAACTCFAIAACEPKEEAADEGAADTTAAELADSAMNNVSAEPVTVGLDDVNDSGIEGEATATHGPNEVTVSILLKDKAQANVSYPAHIHTGTCEKGGPVAVDLGTVQNLQAQKTVPLSSLPREQHYVQVHDPAGKPVACGDMKGHDAAAAHGSAPATSTAH